MPGSRHRESQRTIEAGFAGSLKFSVFSFQQSGRPVQEINRLLEQFKEMQKFMKQMKGLQGMMPRGMPKLGGGAGAFPFGRGN